MVASRINLDLTQLNTAQRQVVESFEGPMMVVAGPGTGKTHVLTYRIAQILASGDVAPQNILALTFTDAAAQTMRRRLVSLIGPTAYQVRLQTFHSFADGVIADHPECFPLKRDGRLVSDLEKISIIRVILDNPAWVYLRSVKDPDYYVSQILTAISKLKRERVEVAQLKELSEANWASAAEVRSAPKRAAAEKLFGKQQELAQLYERYQQYLTERGWYDFDDMLLWVSQVFENQPEILAEYQENLQYLLADEYQDTNASQNQILWQLADFWGEAANVCVVGDPHQTIYRFQGASLENVLTFQDKFPAAEIVTLEQGYRCPQPIYDAAAVILAPFASQYQTVSWIQAASQPLKSVPKSMPEGGVVGDSKPLKIIELPSKNHEDVWIFEQIAALIKSGVSPHEIAILYKKNKEAEGYVTLANHYQIPVQVEQGLSVLDSPEIKQFLHLCQAIIELDNPHKVMHLDQVMLFSWLADTFGLSALASLQLIQAAANAKPRTTVFDLLQQSQDSIASHPGLSHLSEADLDRYRAFLRQFTTWWQVSRTQTLLEWIPLVLAESGFLKYVSAHEERARILEELHTLYEDVKSQVYGSVISSPAAWLEQLQLRQQFKKPLAVASFAPLPNAVTLATVHKAKGKEWRFVFLPQAIDKHWGNARKLPEIALPEGILPHQAAIETDETVDPQLQPDDRRLWYVAMTRAKQQCLVSYTTTTERAVAVKDTVPSQFITELLAEPSLHLTVTNALVAPQILEQVTEGTVIVPATGRWSPSVESWLQALVQEFSLSVSALNSYLRSPEEFFHNTLLRLPQAKDPSQGFGTAVHAALERSVSRYLETGSLPGEHDVTAWFEQALRREVLTETQFQEQLRRGMALVPKVLPDLLDSNGQVMAVEKKFGSGMPVQLGEHRLTGKIDRIDILDATSRSVRVVDYKTGAVRSRNEILGTVGLENLSERERQLPASIRTAYKRQLLFYALLAQLDPSFPYTVTFGQFVFVEPNSKGKSTIHAFEIIPDEVAALSELIQTIMQEIKSLSFLRSLPTW